MKNSSDGDRLKFPVGHAFPEARELSMDDYYEFVVANLVLFGRPPVEISRGSERFVIREEDEPFTSRPPEK